MDVQSFNEITKPFIEALQKESVAVQLVAARLFYYLAIIQISYSVLWMTLAGEGLGRLVNHVVSLAFSLGFFYACMQHGAEWVQLIINGFIETGQDAAQQTINPGVVMNTGLDLASQIIAVIGNWGMSGIILMALVGGAIALITVVTFALLAAEMVIVLVKSYFLVCVSSLFFAFAAHDLTREMTKRYFQTILGVGLHLLSLYLVIGVGNSITDHWGQIVIDAEKQHQLLPLFEILAGMIVYYLITKNIPTFIANLAGCGGMQSHGSEATALPVASGMLLYKMFKDSGIKSSLQSLNNKTNKTAAPLTAKSAATNTSKPPPSANSKNPNNGKPHGAVKPPARNSDLPYPTNPKSK